MSLNYIRLNSLTLSPNIVSEMRSVKKSLICLLWPIFIPTMSNPLSVLKHSTIWWVSVMTRGRPCVMLLDRYFWRTLLSPMIYLCKKLRWYVRVTRRCIYQQLSAITQTFTRPFITRQMSELCLEGRITHWCPIGSIFRLDITGERQVLLCQELR